MSAKTTITAVSGEVRQKKKKHASANVMKRIFGEIGILREMSYANGYRDGYRAALKGRAQ